MFQSAGRIIGWLKLTSIGLSDDVIKVSIRRADYWLVEGASRTSKSDVQKQFQSAGRIIGWLKTIEQGRARIAAIVSIRRADYWLVEALGGLDTIPFIEFQSAGRIIGWLKCRGARATQSGSPSFNPPGGLLVG